MAQELNEFQQYMIEEAIQYNIDKNKPLTECIYRRESDAFVQYFKFLKENQDKYELNSFDKELLSTDIGEKAMYKGEEVWLDLPFVEINEEEKVELNKPKRGGPKKFYVYVKNDKGNIVKVTFGDTTGLSVKFDDEEARKSFVARHDCPNKKDKTKAGYWSCNLPRYAKQLGLSNGGNFFW